MYIVLKSEIKNAQVTVFHPTFAQYSVITSKQYGIGCKLVLITNRKSHMGF